MRIWDLGFRRLGKFGDLGFRVQVILVLGFKGCGVWVSGFGGVRIWCLGFRVSGKFGFSV